MEIGEIRDQVQRMRWQILPCIALLLAGCSARGWFDFGRNLGAGKADCAALVSVDERARCEASFVSDFESYEAERTGRESDQPLEKPSNR